MYFLFKYGECTYVIEKNISEAVNHFEVLLKCDINKEDVKFCGLVTE